VLQRCCLPKDFCDLSSIRVVVSVLEWIPVIVATQVQVACEEELIALASIDDEAPVKKNFADKGFNVRELAVISGAARRRHILSSSTVQGSIPFQTLQSAAPFPIRHPGT